VRFSESKWNLNQTAPSLSEHNKQVYVDQLGYSKNRVAQLKKMGVI
jgi:crotonobetainyl-CoA:carnitine CoA-transferase CaiB-like acyl-CoA transferase